VYENTDRSLSLRFGSPPNLSRFFSSLWREIFAVGKPLSLRIQSLRGWRVGGGGVGILETLLASLYFTSIETYQPGRFAACGTLLP
jgi:hypothetical protein